MKYNLFLLDILLSLGINIFSKILQPSDKCDLILIFLYSDIGTYILMLIIILCETQFQNSTDLRCTSILLHIGTYKWRQKSRWASPILFMCVRVSCQVPITLSFRVLTNCVFVYVNKIQVQHRIELFETSVFYFWKIIKSGFMRFSKPVALARLSDKNDFCKFFIIYRG